VSRIRGFSHKTARLMMDSRVLIDQYLNQGMEQGFSSLSGIMNKLKESEIER
jgi:hypothetical protein